MFANHFKFSVLALLCLALTGCLNLGGLKYNQVRALKKEGFVLTEEGWSLGLPERLLFEFDQAEISVQKREGLVRLSQQLQKYNLTKVKIVGHTDAVGSTEYNLALSKKRAQSVADIFIAEHFNPQNIYVIGRGAAQPIAANDTEQHRAENRRVTVTIVP
ncbi:OmpA family protein [Acinetobacter sp. Marseille-Q1618]|uniref:OmpA family protein n=1 Tax=Acinetobacter sp. Marseille-Q1618 TaxID=2697502 RepID=UPI00156EF032|nr:OmpA family protein [Acinetobacter sp. Marseille-Q1618]